jgi:PII-like signaling protein
MQMRLYFGERDRSGDGPLESAVMAACARRGVQAAALMRGVEGFGGKHRLRTDRLLSLSEDAPLVAVAVGESAVVEGLAEEVRELAGEGLLVLETTTTGTATPSAVVVAAPVVGAPGDDERADRVKVTVWGPRTGPTAPHLEAVAALKRHGAEAATVLLGVDGVLDGERRRARFVAGNRGVPAMTVGVGTRAAIDAAVAEIDGAANFVTVESVVTYRRIATVSHHNEGAVVPKWRISPPTHHADAAVVGKSVIDRVSHHGPAQGSASAEATRVTLVTSETASRGAHPAYLEFIHRLRREGAPGATALRGVWGFRGDGEPRGDRVLALRRDVPMVVEVVDAPEHAARWLELAREVACEGDVVHSQPIRRILTLE